MAHSLSAKKRDRQNEKRKMQNRARRSELKTVGRKFGETVQGGDAAAAEKQMQALYKKADQTAAKGTIHKNTAARKKSRAAKMLNALKAAKK